MNFGVNHAQGAGSIYSTCRPAILCVTTVPQLLQRKVWFSNRKSDQSLSLLTRTDKRHTIQKRMYRQEVGFQVTFGINNIKSLPTLWCLEKSIRQPFLYRKCIMTLLQRVHFWNTSPHISPCCCVTVERIVNCFCCCGCGHCSSCSCCCCWTPASCCGGCFQRGKFVRISGWSKQVLYRDRRWNEHFTSKWKPNYFHYHQTQHGQSNGHLYTGTHQ